MSPSTKPDKAKPSIVWSAGASSTSGLSAVIRGSASKEGGGREAVFESHEDGKDKEAVVRSNEPGAVYKRSSHPEIINDGFRHGASVAAAENRGSPVQQCNVDLAGNSPAAASTSSEGVLHDNSEGLNGNFLEDIRGSRPSSEPRSVNGAEGQALGYGNLESVLSILLHRRESFEVSLGPLAEEPPLLCSHLEGFVLQDRCRAETVGHFFDQSNPGCNLI